MPHASLWLLTAALQVGGGSAPAEPQATDATVRPVSFDFELLPALTQAGCNGGACHGSPSGRGGFSLSLFAYDPPTDHATLVTGALGRRVDLVEPASSLLLRKPTGEISHGGGVRFREGDESLRILRRWLAEGAQGPRGDGVVLDRLVVDPAGPALLTFPSVTQQLRATAHLSDATVLDVTSIVSWFSTDDSVAVVDALGRITGLQRGQCAIVGRYLDRLVSVPVAFVQPRAGYAWSAPKPRGDIDRLVNQRLRDLQYLPAATCDDATFLRRLTLDLTGLLPTAEEARAFLADAAPEKRDALIDRLLDSAEHAAFWANKSADLLRVTMRTLEEDAEPYARRIQASWRHNEPYDEFVRELLAAEADASAYYRAFGDATTRAEATTQVFLGSRLECAKCHNHPYEAWTQDDYYRIATSFSDGVLHARTKAASVPWSGEAGAPVQDRRRAFARWLTRDDERFFARVAVNRMWAGMLGRGIVEPVDDFRSSNPPSNPALLDALAADFVNSGYDRRHILRQIARSQTYQRRSEPAAHEEPDVELFSRQRRRLLDAEQISDAVLRVTRDDDRIARVAAAAQARAQASTRAMAIAEGRTDWVVATREALSRARGVGLGAWSATQPSTADDAFERDFGVEAISDDPQASATLAWTRHDEWLDGEVHPLPMPDRSALYLARTVTAAAPCRLKLSLGSDDGIRVWVAGAEVLTRKVSRGVAPDQDEVTVEIPAGQSAILMKIWNGGGGAGFYFDAGMTVDERLIELLEAEANGPLGADQLAELRRRHLESDSAWRSLDEGARRLEDEVERWFATQRLVPDAGSDAGPGADSRSTFLAAFGQPPRATSCSCERAKEPTLAQALQMLNGRFVDECVRAAARRYRDAPDGLNEVYLATLARLPSSDERSAVDGFLQPSSVESWEDLLWALLNTQEFLFQH